MLDEIFAARDLAEWATILAGLSTPWSIVQSAAEAAVDPQVVANGLVASVEGRYPLLVRSPAQFDELPTGFAARAPAWGAHRRGSPGARTQLGRHRRAQGIGRDLLAIAGVFSLYRSR